MHKLFIFTLMAQVVMLIVVACTPTSAPVQVLTPVPGSKSSTPQPGQIDVPAVSIQVNAPGPNPLQNKPDVRGQTAGIVLGLWHGIISPVTIILSFVNKDVQMYEVHNDGSPYNFGFFLGILLLIGIAGIGVGSRRGV